MFKIPFLIEHVNYIVASCTYLLFLKRQNKIVTKTHDCIYFLT